MILHDYESSSGKDLIMEYLDSLPEDERTDGLMVMKCMENNEFDKILFTFFMLAENRRIKQKRMIVR